MTASARTQSEQPKQEGSGVWAAACRPGDYFTNKRDKLEPAAFGKLHLYYISI